jgi:hypothetical protein
MALVPQRNTNIVNVYSVTLPEGDRLQFQGRGNWEGDWARRKRGTGAIRTRTELNRGPVASTLPATVSILDSRPADSLLA